MKQLPTRILVVNLKTGRVHQKNAGRLRQERADYAAMAEWTRHVRARPMKGNPTMQVVPGMRRTIDALGQRVIMIFHKT